MFVASASLSLVVCFEGTVVLAAMHTHQKLNNFSTETTSAAEGLLIPNPCGIAMDLIGQIPN